LAAGILEPRVFNQKSLPVGPRWPDVQRILAASDPREIRGRAVLLPFALYRFRSGEWPRYGWKTSFTGGAEIAVAHPKQRRAHEYPLVPTAARAILH
jgi:hypothetical protein